MSATRFHTCQRPFLHAVIDRVFTKENEADILNLLESSRWMRVDGSFFRFDVMRDSTDMVQLTSLLNASGSAIELTKALESTFHCRLNSKFLLEVHRYSHGSGIGAHTDATCSEVRCVLNFERLSDNAPGLWILSSDSALGSERRLLAGLSNTGWAFETQPRSFHALAVRHAGTSYGVTLRYSQTFVA